MLNNSDVSKSGWCIVWMATAGLAAGIIHGSLTVHIAVLVGSHAAPASPRQCGVNRASFTNHSDCAEEYREYWEPGQPGLFALRAIHW